MQNRPPVVGVWGRSGSGKTHLIVELLHGWFRHENLRVAVVKRCSHRMQVDAPGKDSDVLFRAGADVFAHNPEQGFLRCRPGDAALNDVLHWLTPGYDLILVEGHRESPIPKLWLASEEAPNPPPDARNVVAVLARDETRTARAEEILTKLLKEAHARTPTYAAVLVGGRSRRMGRPKSLLRTLEGFLI